MAAFNAGATKKQWGDDDEDNEEQIGQEITTESVTEADGSIKKTVVEYKKNDKGQTVKIISTIRMRKAKVKVNKRAEERRRWKKFGEASGAKGPEPGITNIADEVFIDLANEEGQAGEGVRGKKEVAINLGIVCRNCGKTGDHWTHKCPYFKGDRLAGDMPPAEDAPIGREGSGMAMSGSLPGGKSVYVPPSRRTGGPTPSGSSMPASGDKRQGGQFNQQNDELATVRVTNLSEDTKESDLNELFRSFGPIHRIFLAKDKNTMLSKGFAYINFVYREDAAKAIEKLSGKFGYDHLILHLEWAKPSNK